MSRRNPSAASPHGKPSKRLSTRQRPRARITLAGRCPRAVPGPNGGAGFGVSPGARVIRGLHLHITGRMSTEPATGQVYGRFGLPIGFVDKASGYVRIGGVMAREGLPQYGHRLVYESVFGEVPPGLHIDHKNGIRHDNRICNLQAVTPYENTHLAIKRNGGRGKLDEATVRRLRSASNRRTDAEWAEALDVAPKTIKAARTGKTWRHVRPRPRMQSRRRPRAT